MKLYEFELSSTNITSFIYPRVFVVRSKSELSVTANVRSKDLLKMQCHLLTAETKYDC